MNRDWREQLIGKLSDTMDPDNARAMVDDAIRSDWQPIDTVPADTWVLVWRIEWTHATIARCAFNYTVQGWGFFDESDHPFTPNETPTHWMPLPDPPARR